jgi:adenosyl cobinamide kinase/adenosyl cobinamide phosphate guanylyltransferase
MNFFVKVKTYTWCSKVQVLSVKTSRNVKTHNSQREEYWKVKKKQLTLAKFAKWS